MKVHSRLTCGAAVLLAYLPATPAQDLPPIDAPRIAAKLVSAFKATKGERVVMAYDPTYYPELERELRALFRAAGAGDITSYRFDDPAFAKLPEAEAVAKLRPAFEKADIFLWLPGRFVGGDRRWERLLDAGHARGIHFHWIGTLAGKGSDEIATLTKLYEKTVLETDYTALSREQDRLIAALRGQTVRITTPNGTDLRLRVPKDAWFHKNDGDISPAGARRGKALRDREMEFPAGALRFIPDWESVEGKLVFPITGLRVTFKKGQAVDMPQRIPPRDDDSDKAGEVVIGTNPLLVLSKPLPSGQLPYYGYGAGYVRISLGDNWESGGPLRVPGTINQWLFLERATVEAGGKALIRDGKLVR